MKPRLSFLFLPLSAVAIAACARDGDPSPAGPAGAAAALAPAPGRSVEIAEIAWPEAASLDREAIALLGREADLARTSPVPVLVPKRASLLSAAKIVAREHWCSVSARAEGITVTASATRLAHRYPSIPPVAGRHLVRGLPGFVTQNEAIWSATWIEHGASYTIELECADPRDARCATDALLLELARDLAYVGGAGAEVGR